MKKRIHYGWMVLGIGSLRVCGALGLARFGYTTVLPAMQAEFGLDNERAGLLATYNLVGYLVLSVAGGALASAPGWLSLWVFCWQESPWS